MIRGVESCTAVRELGADGLFHSVLDAERVPVAFLLPRNAIAQISVIILAGRIPDVHVSLIEAPLALNCCE